MPRPIDLQKLKAGWDKIAAGHSNAASGVHTSFAPLLRRLIESGVKWDMVVAKMKLYGNLALVADDLAPKGKEPVKMPGLGEPPGKRPPQAARPPKPRVEVIQTDRYDPAPRHATTWQERARVRSESQRQHVETEIKHANRVLRFCEEAWDTVEAFPRKKVKRSNRPGMCPHCNGSVVVEEVHIHPGKVDLSGLIKAQSAALDRLRLAHGLPKAVLAIRVGDGRIQEQMELVNEAFKTAFSDGIKSGLVTEQAAVEIWEIARRIIDGANETRMGDQGEP